jgi:WS/DGAT/MGAT family acyltransferase
MLKGDADPRTRAVMTGVLILDNVPACDRLHAAFERATRLVPRMRQRVLAPALPIGPAVWADDPEFDVHDHLHRIAVLPGAGPDAVFDIAVAGATASFDMARPLWEAIVVDGLDGGRAALIVRAHHSLTDGLGAVAMLGALVSFDRDDPPDVAGELESSVVDARSLLVHRLARLPKDAVASTARRTATAVTFGARLAFAPGEGIALAASARRLLSPPDAAPSPLLCERSRRREYVALEVPLDAMHAAAAAAGCTVNDAYLTAVLGGFRRYYAQLGAAPSDVPLALPISIRDSEMLAAGNHFSAARLAGPATIADPTERMRTIHDQVARARCEPALGAIDSVAEVARHVPAGLARTAFRSHARHTDLQASNITGTPVPIFVAGAGVERIYPFGPLPGVPVMTVLLSHCGTCCVGITLDPAAITEPDRFADCVRAGFDEVVGRAGATRIVSPRRADVLAVDDAEEAGRRLGGRGGARRAEDVEGVLRVGQFGVHDG